MYPQVLRYAAFTTDPAGGNPAGVVLDARGLTDQQMQQVAGDVGYSETAFLTPRPDGAHNARYFSPQAEVPFCGHATVAAAIAYAERHPVERIVLHTPAGVVPVEIDADQRATLVSVPPAVVPLPGVALDDILAALRWRASDLDPLLEPAVGYAGAWHPVIPVATRRRLAQLDYDFDALRSLMLHHGWTTVNLVWRETSGRFHARNPFPVGGVVEDPATGAAAAALGAFLAERNALPPSRRITIHQGHDMGRDSIVDVAVPRDVASGIRVSGAAVPIAGRGS